MVRQGDMVKRVDRIVNTELLVNLLIVSRHTGTNTCSMSGSKREMM